MKKSVSRWSLLLTCITMHGPENVKFVNTGTFHCDEG